MELKIDYSNIPETPVIHKDTYRKPRHVYFGKRDPQTGMMEEEPRYEHQEYPRIMYKLIGDRIVAEIVENDTDMTHKLNSGWAKNPAAFGYLTAPSWDETLAMKKGVAESVGKQPEDIDTGAGEKKWRDMNAQERAAYQAKKQAEAEAALEAQGKAA